MRLAKILPAEERMLKIILAEQERGMLNILIRDNNLEIVREILERGKVDASTFADADDDEIATIHYCESPEMLRLLTKHGGEDLITKESMNDGITLSFIRLSLTTHDLKMVRCLFEEYHVGPDVGGTIRNTLHYTSRNKAIREAWGEKKEDDVFLYVFKKFPDLVKVKAGESGEYPITPILVRGDISIIAAVLENPTMKAALLGINFDNENNVIHEMVKISSKIKRTVEDVSEKYEINRKTVENHKRIIHLFSEKFPEFLSQENHDGLTPFAYAIREKEFDFAREMFEVCPSILARDSSFDEDNKIALSNDILRGKKDVSEELVLAALDEKMFRFFNHLHTKADKKLFNKFLPKIYEKLCVAIKENDIESAIKIAEIFPEFIEKKYPKPVKRGATLEQESIEIEDEVLLIPTIGFALELGRDEIVNAFHQILEEKEMLQPATTTYKAEIEEFKKTLTQGIRPT
jgi:hypothetical protein